MPVSLENSIQLQREWVNQSTDAASNWRSRNNRGRELFCLYNALENSLCVAVSDYGTPQLGIEYLKSAFKPKVFDRTLELICQLHIDGDIRSENIGSPTLSTLMLVVHSAWLLDLYDEAKEIASICDKDDQLRLYQSDTLWRDYARGIAAVAYGRQFIPVQKKYKGYDRHWSIYLQLMSDICAGKDLSLAISSIDESFSQRNRDKRLIDKGLDGDGTFPVKWDFRKHSLLLVDQYNVNNAR